MKLYLTFDLIYILIYTMYFCVHGYIHVYIKIHTLVSCIQYIIYVACVYMLRGIYVYIAHALYSIPHDLSAAVEAQKILCTNTQYIDVHIFLFYVLRVMLMYIYFLHKVILIV